MGLSVLLAVASFYAGWKIFTDKFFISDIFKSITSVQKVLENKYYVDELYDFLIISPLKAISKWSAEVFDKLVIDGAVNGAGGVSKYFADKMRLIQTGDLQSYAVAMIVGVFLIIITVVGILNN